MSADDGARSPADERQTSPFGQEFHAPSIQLPKGGGAIRGIGEKFVGNPVTGAGSMSVPIATSPGRSGFGPTLSLTYDSSSGNGPFGFGPRKRLSWFGTGTEVDAVSVTGLAVNFWTMPRIAPPPFGMEMADPLTGGVPERSAAD